MSSGAGPDQSETRPRWTRRHVPKLVGLSTPLISYPVNLMNPPGPAMNQHVPSEAYEEYAMPSSLPTTASDARLTEQAIESPYPPAPQNDRAPGLFEAIHRLAPRQTVQLIIAAEDEVRVRLTAIAIPRGSGSEGKADGKKDEPSVGAEPAFAPITLVATPRELDDRGGGLAVLFTELREQHASLAEVRARAAKAHEDALAAEKRREEEARDRKKQADPGGPLFGG